MKYFEFDKTFIESKFTEAENFLFAKENIYLIKYDNFDVATFDKLNSELLKNASNKFIVYCLWLGNKQNELEPKYVGHAKNTISRQRLRAHLTKKNKATGSQLDKITKYLDEKKYFGLTYLTIEPSYMRTSLEEWLINKNIEKLDWNKNK
jgi:phage gp37-like protein